MNWLNIITYFGIFMFAVTGALKARTYLMDIFGAIVLAFVTAYGGGTVRDIFLGIKPVWLNDNLAIIFTFAALVIVYLFKENVARFTKFMFITDAIGLGLFTAVGIRVGAQNGANDAYSIVMGIITATFGGLLSDILSNTVPALMKKGELYATASLIGGICYVVLHRVGMGDDLNMVLCVAVVVLVRIISKRKRIYLPEI